jgi:hypothetical protein
VAPSQHFGLLSLANEIDVKEGWLLAKFRPTSSSIPVQPSVPDPQPSQSSVHDPQLTQPSETHAQGDEHEGAMDWNPTENGPVITRTNLDAGMKNF